MRRYSGFEDYKHDEYENKHNQVDEKEEEKSEWYSSPQAKLGIILLFLGIVVFVIYQAFQFYEDWKDSRTLTVEKTTDYLEPYVGDFNQYLQYIKSYGVDEPIEDFVYNVKIPDEIDPKEIDPLYDDPYVGYEENEDLHASLFEVDDGFVFFLYHPKTKDVEEVFEWTNENIELSLQIYKTRGEKAELIKESIENPSTKEENKKKIEGINERLVELFDQVLQEMSF